MAGDLEEWSEKVQEMEIGQIKREIL
jgi:hypothetical protein